MVAEEPLVAGNRGRPTREIQIVPPYLLGLRLDGRRVVVIGGGRSPSAACPRCWPPAPRSCSSPRGRRRRWRTSPRAGRDHLGAAAVPRRRLRRRLARAGVHRRRQGQRGGRRRGRAPADLVRARRRRGGVRRLDAGQRRVGETTVGVLGGGDPRRAAGSATPSSTGCATARSTPGTRGASPWASRSSAAAPATPGLITVRGRQLLAEADVVVTDRLAPRDAARRARRRRRDHRRGQDPVRPLDDAGAHQRGAGRARPAGRFVVRLKGGDPFVFGRGGEEVAALRAARGSPSRSCPGITSAIAVPSAAGIPVTHRGRGAGVPRRVRARRPG